MYVLSCRRRHGTGAGVWHNIVLSLLCWLCILGSPLLFMPFYYTGYGAVVVQDIPSLGIVSGDIVIVRTAVMVVVICRVSVNIVVFLTLIQ